MHGLERTRLIQIVDKVALNMGISAKMSLDVCSCWLPCEMAETWARGDGDEAGIRGLGLALGPNR